MELSLRNALADRSSLLKSAMFSLSILKDEMQKNTTYTLPFISLTVFLLVSFTIGSWYALPPRHSSDQNCSMTGDWITSKPMEALMGVFSSSLAIASAGGLLFALGVPYISQVSAPLTSKMLHSLTLGHRHAVSRVRDWRGRYVRYAGRMARHQAEPTSGETYGAFPGRSGKV